MSIPWWQNLSIGTNIILPCDLDLLVWSTFFKLNPCYSKKKHLNSECTLRALILQMIIFWDKICPLVSRYLSLWTWSSLKLAMIRSIGLCGYFHPTWKCFTNLEISPSPVKGCNFWPALCTWIPSNEGSVACNTYLETRHPFTMVISRTVTHLMANIVITCFYDLSLLCLEL